MTKKRKVLVTMIFFAALLTLPGTIIFLKNPQPFINPMSKFHDFKWHGFVNEANMLRGQVDQANIPNLGRLTASKSEIAFHMYLDTALTTLDPHFLFFEGDINQSRSTKNVGAVYLIFLPLAFIGLRSLSNINRFRILGLILFFTLVAGLWGEIYFITVRLPIILIVTGLAFVGWLTLFKISKRWAYVVFAIYLFQIVSNMHFIFNHFLL